MDRWCGVFFGDYYHDDSGEYGGIKPMTTATKPKTPFRIAGIPVELAECLYCHSDEVGMGYDVARVFATCNSCGVTGPKSERASFGRLKMTVPLAEEEEAVREAERLWNDH